MQAVDRRRARVPADSTEKLANVLQHVRPESIPRQELNVTDRPKNQRGAGTPIGRRSVLMMLVAAGVLAPLVGTGTARAAGKEDPCDVPEECGALPWT